MLRIAFIDSFSTIQKAQIAHYTIIKENIKRVSTPLNGRTHADDCIEIFMQNSKNCVKIISLDVFSKGEQYASIDNLIACLQWCINEQVKIINLSMGSISYTDYNKLNNIITMLYEKNIILIAAGNNQNRVTLPASMYKVIGVRGDAHDQIPWGQWFYSSNDLAGLEITVHTPLTFCSDFIFSPDCNSYACAYISAIVSNYIFDNGICDITIDSIHKFLWKNSCLCKINNLLFFNKALDEVKCPIIYYVDKLHNTQYCTTNSSIYFILKIEVDNNSEISISGKKLGLSYNSWCLKILYNLFYPDLLIVFTEKNCLSTYIDADILIKSNGGKYYINWDENTIVCNHDELVSIIRSLLV